MESLAKPFADQRVAAIVEEFSVHRHLRDHATGRFFLVDGRIGFDAGHSLGRFQHDVPRWFQLDPAVSDDCRRSELAVYSEDRSMGNFINSHPQKTIKRIRLVTDEFKHPVKRIDRLQALWTKYLGAA